jgi:pimeloyl-ACP methyl ester carboxylesterase
MAKLVAADVEAVTVSNCGHFVPEECPDELVQRILLMANR